MECISRLAASMTAPRQRPGHRGDDHNGFSSAARPDQGRPPPHFRRSGLVEVAWSAFQQAGLTRNGAGVQNGLTNVLAWRSRPFPEPTPDQ
jgi:hypothetical protein